MKRLEIEWRHLDKAGKTCDRCSDTGTEVRRACEDLTRELEPAGWMVSFRETRLTEKEIPESNAVLLNGIPIEELLPKARKSENCCASCGDLLGAPTNCRTIVRDGRTYETIPAAMIVEAARHLLDKLNG
jgi:hypothetical protein